MVERQRALRERRRREADEADPVVRAAADELLRGVLRDREPVAAAHVAGAHARRDVDRQHDVDAARVDLALLDPLLRPRRREQRENERGPRQHAHDEPEPAREARVRQARRGAPQQRVHRWHDAQQ